MLTFPLAPNFIYILTFYLFIHIFYFFVLIGLLFLMGFIVLCFFFLRYTPSHYIVVSF
ncbi:hypothetical protein GLOIN_2v1673448 [Rhizophagus irregularis DAOM 181602=DAOM 197198]|uniref:Uncharacterized protein n=1 Tax=Rhizophagus irregularis (strain DAOM 181602 / DAOM 197198 / MUCL 43194) TaxID=747089 RepID=A0A2P4PGU0_RHIID|nr:hypothetical protein GLOIN_2v1673448 [Rhizophagus irregularis DAOM 181602=DAOM 197198]POG64580.1 hypothetical protein GLOIN_2v1673448 [Rhizophagus irregularis DAOM 181602=DAOM 197198]|eukprot:XP_025171446.1 hypothetical protein GLOIN_2v1673448 [Rhizophagus irregularis DAOM 181602=DAOM 197198]